MEEALIRTALLLGKAGMEKLNAARVAVFGIGVINHYLQHQRADCGAPKGISLFRR